MDENEIYFIAKVRLDKLMSEPHLYDNIKDDIITQYRGIFKNDDDAKRAYILSYYFWKCEVAERSKVVDYIY